VTVELPIDADTALGLPVDRLALHLLRDIKATSEAAPNQQPHRYNFLDSAYAGYSKAGLERDQVTAVTQALAEAYDWLLLHGLLSLAPRDYNSGWLFITRKGEAVLAAPDGLRLVQAEASLDVDMHPRIAGRIRSQFLLGEYELAALAAMREIEIRVRELANAAPRDVGVDLMKQSFAKDGPLTDPNAVKAEQEATMALFWGAIGVFKNPPSHRQVDYADPTLASEVVLFADLLLRMLDERAAALGLT
jgi:uncharacterized protein (TIGR02391 family)